MYFFVGGLYNSRDYDGLKLHSLISYQSCYSTTGNFFCVDKLKSLNIFRYYITVACGHYNNFESLLVFYILV